VFHDVVEQDGRARSIPYGRPLTNQHLYVLDDRLEPRPDLVAGDLHIAGAGLARGYWRDPEQTAASFFVHPGTGERLYRTGDLARHLPDGELEFLGREDQQVKINGHRIELGEVEAELQRHPAVRVAVASANGDPKFGRSLHAHVVLRDGPTGADDLKQFLAGRLPKQAVPARIVVLDAMPLTANGKVDRAALLRLDSGQSPRSELVPAVAGSARAEALAALLTELLGRPVGLDDDIWALGANSLIAVQLVARAEDVGIRLSAADVMTSPSPGLLAVAVQNRVDGAGAHG
jgi:hypothetical protein